MDDKVKIGAAIAAGYLLGRTKKGKAALGLTLWLGGSRLGLDPKNLAREAVTRLAKSPQVRQLGEQLRGPLADAGKRAVVATVESRVNRFADSLSERTSALQGAGDESGQEEASKDEDAEDKGSTEDKSGQAEAGEGQKAEADDSDTGEKDQSDQPRDESEGDSPRVPRQQAGDRTPDHARG